SYSIIGKLQFIKCIGENKNMYPIDRPEKIYRYQKIDLVTMNSLFDDKLYFSDPSKFNDAFERSPVITGDSEIDDLRLILKKLIEERTEREVLPLLSQVGLNDIKAINFSKKRGDERARFSLKDVAYMATNPDNGFSDINTAEYAGLIREIDDEIKKNYTKGVCCFSSTMDNNLLWSHYGDSHSGFCIGYEFFNPEELNGNKGPDLHKVDYREKRELLTSLIYKAVIHDNINAKNDLDSKVLLQKSKGWEYEKEWRLLDNKGSQESSLKLIDVTFGLRCDYSMIGIIVNVLKDRVKFYKIYDAEKSFELQRHELDPCAILVGYPRGTSRYCFSPI
ncbi:hypothetical protein BMR08_15230, partial [Methylococcaceae bacterium CS2]